ncbi:3-methyl-2-oxobutanoatehydroxymethyltransferase [Xylanimonas cellulosilytica DSM 15894]|uniref:3-methyl-2-oxobutanoate hydroxymethyltransferase n=1 Tax=Xylanimonas cellulosilytica (strain DSM 15894 / JCM 12276 / CECT 5975 / KCTC 9989 / LMG 20990 / NBRC 107835 / XIL07) TaxID=446471 RepID=D1BSH7_XYLCX|nr:3-methyl-2-oxobutanoate hydroxymethyltransferase [Xylanimonas cellulosilytica]ACZ30669.1 3-methyl-2-oxobutanoatehydroxymethyltransferase [Xylanimonas cellulosilytica DSM 15894]
MSHHANDPAVEPVETTPRRKRVTPPSLAALAAAGEKLVMVTAYDYPAAVAAEKADVDIVLVGDSGAQVQLGYDSTVPVSVDEMLVLAQAVRRGTTTALVVVDLPFGSYEVSDEQAVATAIRFVKEAGADAVKLEGGGRVPAARIRAITAAGIPVMGHVGLTPQTAVALGGFAAQGRTVEAARRVRDEALAVQEAGAFSLVLEAIPSDLAAAIRPQLTIPAIGIGAGPAVDGQVLVLHDLLGLTEGRAAKFVKRYATVLDAMTEGIGAYAADVRSGAYPGPEHGYAMPEGVLDALDG